MGMRNNLASSIHKRKACRLEPTHRFRNRRSSSNLTWALQQIKQVLQTVNTTWTQAIQCLTLIRSDCLQACTTRQAIPSISIKDSDNCLHFLEFIQGRIKAYDVSAVLTEPHWLSGL